MEEGHGGDEAYHGVESVCEAYHDWGVQADDGRWGTEGREEGGETFYRNGRRLDNARDPPSGRLFSRG